MWRLTVSNSFGCDVTTHDTLTECYALIDKRIATCEGPWRFEIESI
jgi:hypothetical protein